MPMPTIPELLAQLHAPQPTLLAVLEAAQIEDARSLWQQDSRLYHAFGQALISAGHPTRAYELLRAGREAHPDEPALQYLSALALARGGNATRAGEQLQTLLNTTTLPPALRSDGLSLAGRLAKDQYAQTRRPQHAALAAASYAQAAYLTGSAFPSINAATMFLLAGQPASAQRLAQHALQAAMAERQQSGHADDYWLLATLGEACLHLGQPDQAAAWYAQAVTLAQGRLGDIASMRRQLHLLAEPLAVSPSLLAVFDVGPVVVFSGHMIDHPTRPTPRFPPDPRLEASVRMAIAQALDDLQATVGYSAAACGADILFAEAMLERGKELHLVLPFHRDDFYPASVDFGLEAMAGWRARCAHILAHATHVHDATDQPSLGEAGLFAFANTVTQGLAITRAAELDVSPYALVLRDPASAEVAGGTGSFLCGWQASGQRLGREIDLGVLRDALPPPLQTWPQVGTPSRTRPASPMSRVVKAMLFGDVKHFSHFGDAQIPAFLTYVMEHVAQLVQEMQPPPVFSNTWGDGLFLVFDTVQACARFALRLLAWLETVPWTALGLPADTAVRLGLHAGPVYPYLDRIIGRQNFFGSHVTRAARIEPVTTPGCAYVSEQFAALVAVECGAEFACDYVGVEQLAKEYSRCPLYRLRWREAPLLLG